MTTFDWTLNSKLLKCDLAVFEPVFVHFSVVYTLTVKIDHMEYSNGFALNSKVIMWTK